jgi:hypothetical protein
MSQYRKQRARVIWNLRHHMGLSPGWHTLVVVEGVTLAQTGFDAWCLAFVGGLFIALGLAVQAGRRRR